MIEFRVDNEATGPLAGVKVVDMTSVGMGPYATQILGDMGATVLKIESPEGDVFRHPAPYRNPAMGAAFLNLNRNKQFCVLNVKVAAELAQLKALIDQADVFVSNVRPSALARLGLDYQALALSNPRLIYCSACGYSEKGPYAGEPAFDDIIQARSGMAEFQRSGSDQSPRYVNTILADKVAGLTIAYSVPMALFEREKSRRGQAIEVPMFETLVSFLAAEHLAGETFVPALGTAGYARVLSPYRKPYRTMDGFIALLPYTSAQWQRFFLLSGRDDLAKDSRFNDMTGRSAHIDELYETLANIVAEKTTADWLECLRDADIPHCPVNRFGDLPNDPHLLASGFFYEYFHPTEGLLRGAGIPVDFSRTPGNIRRHPGALRK
ncbi:TPA: CaiB/BaiF CoA transferase family protein [Pseudomonas aeruginosa]|nr:CoA transferase [Pseudomonas aeruginosa]MCT0747821.1 CoA transferase [Pseudomonas aeruginosa]HBO3197557.1 CoA transferase [Pseudomonas aeruginosa]HBO4618034.1 CoA transferase [Pseudomonas aeruginosa]